MDRPPLDAVFQFERGTVVAADRRIEPPDAVSA
jgi:hypothetical protein